MELPEFNAEAAMPVLTRRPRERKRREPFFDHVRYTRWPGKGRKLQLRWWLTGFGSINLGMYERELVAAVRRKLVPRTRHHPDTPLGLWTALVEVLDGLKRVGVTGLPDVLPLYVRRRPDGRFRAQVRKGGRLVVLAGPFEAPDAAHRAMVAHLAREFPGWQWHLPTKKPMRVRRATDGVSDAA